MAGLPLIWIIFIGFTLLSWLVSHQLQSRFKKYSKIPTANGMTGRDVVEKMLRDNGVQGVKIGSVEGQLTDHYNPTNKTINLSHEVYYGANVAAAAVAAHECGHALQHAQAYSMLQLRSALVPVVSFASHWVQWILLAGIILVISYLTMPQAIAGMFYKNFTKQLVLSTIISCVGSVIGLFASAALKLPSGATIVLCFLLIFIVCYLLRRRK